MVENEKYLKGLYMFLIFLQVCHNKSGEINPIKIRDLVQGYIKKVKYYRKKQTGAADPLPTKPSATEPSAPTFILIPKVAKPPTPIKSKA